MASGFWCNGLVLIQSWAAERGSLRSRGGDRAAGVRNVWRRPQQSTPTNAEAQRNANVSIGSPAAAQARVEEAPVGALSREDGEIEQRRGVVPRFDSKNKSRYPTVACAGVTVCGRDSQCDGPRRRRRSVLPGTA